MEHHSGLFNQQQKNIFYISLLSIVEGIQLLIFTALVATLLPAREVSTAFLTQIQPRIAANHDFFLYRFFIIATMAIHAYNFYYFRNNIKNSTPIPAIKKFILIEGALLFGTILAVYEIILFQNPIWARSLLYGLLAAHILWAGLSRIFSVLVDTLAHWDLTDQFLYNFRVFCDFIIPVFIICTVFIPDRYGLFTALYSVDHLNHIDAFIMSPGWAYLNGAILNVDVFSLYGIGMPMFISKLSQWLGGFTYENVITILLLMIIMYFIFLYFFLRFWLRSVFIAISGVFLAIKFQIFNFFPVLLMYPSRSAVRYFFDIPFFALLLVHMKYRKNWILLIASAICGITLCFITDAGIYLTLALFAYIVLTLLFPASRHILYQSPKDIAGILCLFLLPALIYAVFLISVVGNHILTTHFWSNNFSFGKNATLGFGSTRWFETLYTGEYLAFAVGCLIPVFYLFTIIFLGAQSLVKKEKYENIFVITICVYGLALFHYYVWRSLATNYYVVCVPVIIILCFWLRKIIDSVDRPKKIVISLGLLPISLFALFSTQQFIQCPNLLNFANTNFDINKKFIIEEPYATDRDIELIQKFTEPGEKTCLLSSFETGILIKANRAPFFFRFRMVVSKFFNHYSFIGFTLRRKADLEITMRQLENEKPEYIFISKKLFSGKIAPSVLETHESIPIIMSHITKHYKPVEFGNFLIALKRK